MISKLQTITVSTDSSMEKLMDKFMTILQQKINIWKIMGEFSMFK
jgi:hypothetical protein